MSCESFRQKWDDPVIPSVARNPAVGRHHHRQHSGAFLYIERPGNDEVTLEARVAALRPPPLPTILVEGPIVREADFLEGTSNLISIPVSSERRKLLRIYDAKGTPGWVRVRVWNLTDSNEPLGELDVLLMPPPWDDSGASPFKPFPASAAISLDLEFPAIRELEDFENLRVEIEPLKSEMRYWAFVTVTDNVTQQVLMITPLAGKEAVSGLGDEIAKQKHGTVWLSRKIVYGRE